MNGDQPRRIRILLLAAKGSYSAAPIMTLKSPRTCEAIGTDPVAALEWHTGELIATAADG
jgi:hypothetical protein